MVSKDSRAARWLGAALSLWAAACADTGFDAGDAAVDAGSTRDFWSAPDLPDGGARSDRDRCEETIDLVLVLDLSSSMSFVLDTLAAEIDKVVSAANALQAGAHFGLVVFVDNVHLDTTGPEEDGKVHLTGATLKAAFKHYKDTYTAFDRNPGDGPNGPTLQNPICEENSLDAIFIATRDFPWRATATRIIIVATDDTFLEKPDNYGDRDADGKWDKLDFPREGNYPAQLTLTEVAGALAHQRVRVFSFTRTQPPGPFEAGCGTGRRLPASSISAGWSAPYQGQAPIPQQSSGKNFDLVQVRDGLVSLTNTINDVVLDSHCNPIK